VVKVERINVIGLFLGDHQRIVKLLNEFKRSKRSQFKKTKEIFEQLDFSIRKHQKQEEILYMNYKQTTGEFIPALQTIRREHQIIEDHLDRIRRAMNDGSKIETAKLYPLLERHKNIEERLLYPELDNVLSEKEKEDVYWKIKVK
jgi:hemerythrin superfamily protein